MALFDATRFDSELRFLSAFATGKSVAVGEALQIESRVVLLVILAVDSTEDDFVEELVEDDFLVDADDVLNEDDEVILLDALLVLLEEDDCLTEDVVDRKLGKDGEILTLEEIFDDVLMVADEEDFLLLVLTAEDLLVELDLIVVRGFLVELEDAIEDEDLLEDVLGEVVRRLVVTVD